MTLIYEVRDCMPLNSVGKVYAMCMSVQYIFFYLDDIVSIFILSKVEVITLF